MDTYKKKYEEALERAKEYHSVDIDNTMDVKARGIMEYLFPELKINEDEKIRKRISQALHGDVLDFDEIIQADTWLEKQGECHISHDDEIMIKQLTEYFTTGHGLQNTNETVVEWLNDVKEKLEKQGEQKQEINNFKVIPGLYKCVHRMFDGTPDGRLLFEVGNVYRCLSKHDRAECEVSYRHSV